MPIYWPVWQHTDFSGIASRIKNDFVSTVDREVSVSATALVGYWCIFIAHYDFHSLGARVLYSFIQILSHNVITSVFDYFLMYMQGFRLFTKVLKL